MTTLVNWLLKSVGVRIRLGELLQVTIGLVRNLRLYLRLHLIVTYPLTVSIFLWLSIINFLSLGWPLILILMASWRCTLVAR